MKTTAHIYASAAAGGAAYALTGSPAMAVSCLLSGVLLGTGLHLLMDQLGNKALNKWFYFMTFRYRSGFASGALTTGRGARGR